MQNKKSLNPVSMNVKTSGYIKQIIAVVFFGFITVGLHAQFYTDFEFYDTATPKIRQAMQNNAKAVFKVIHEAYFNNKQPVILLSENNATKVAIERTQALLSTSKFHCRQTNLKLPVLQTSKAGFQVRNIPVIFVDGKTDADKYQNMVLEFTPDGKINDVLVALPMKAYENIIEKGDHVTDLRCRFMIIGYLENLLNAYYQKDIAFLSRIFSNDVLDKNLHPIGNSPLTSGTERNMRLYIDNLKRVFAQNGFFNIKFDGIEVVQHDEKPYIYGVMLRMQWNTSTYSDGGWLFQMIDFRNEDNPVIWVRTWQPLDTPKERLYDLKYFPIR